MKHYALICTGMSFGGKHAAWYWYANNNVFQLLLKYGYRDIYRLSEAGSAHYHTGIAMATRENMYKLFEHFTKELTNKDSLTVFLIGHGTMLPHSNWGYKLVDGVMTASEIRDMSSAIKAKISFIIHPCFSGRAIAYLKKPGRTILTSVGEEEENSVDWIGKLTFTLQHKLGISLWHALEETTKMPSNQEHPQFWGDRRRCLGDNGSVIRYRVMPPFPPILKSLEY